MAADRGCFRSALGTGSLTVTPTPAPYPRGHLIWHPGLRCVLQTLARSWVTGAHLSLYRQMRCLILEGRSGSSLPPVLAARPCCVAVCCGPSGVPSACSPVRTLPPAAKSQAATCRPPPGVTGPNVDFMPKSENLRRHGPRVGPAVWAGGPPTAVPRALCAESCLQRACLMCRQPPVRTGSAGQVLFLSVMVPESTLSLSLSLLAQGCWPLGPPRDRHPQMPREGPSLAQPAC